MLLQKENQSELRTPFSGPGGKSPSTVEGWRPRWLPWRPDLPSETIRRTCLSVCFHAYLLRSFRFFFFGGGSFYVSLSFLSCVSFFSFRVLFFKFSLVLCIWSSFLLISYFPLLSLAPSVFLSLSSQFLCISHSLFLSSYTYFSSHCLCSSFSCVSLFLSFSISLICLSCEFRRGRK